ncbi:MAG: hypothetical protein ACI9K2_004882 [Myxococcota bacterium]|jgi:hypothetical protein
MRWLFVWITVLIALPGQAEPGHVDVALTTWEATLAELEARSTAAPPPIPVVAIDRTIDGRFHKGVFSGTLVSRFEVLADGAHVRVPVLDSATSVGEVLLDGRPTSLLPEGGMYTVGIDGPGIYRIEVRFFQGRESDRFARKLAFSLPPAGPTALRVWVPERGIDATLAHGAITASTAESGGTWLQGQLDARGLVDLAWSRRLDHTASTDVRTQARLNTLYTLQESMVRGVAAFDVEVLEGEVDRLDLVLPDDIEIVDVTGDAVLQWHTESADSGRLAVLLRYLVADAVKVRVHFQFPVDLDQPVVLRMPLPPPEVPFEGAAGVLGPAGIEVVVDEVVDAAAQTVRDLPPELTDLTASPLLLGFTFEAPPRVTLGLSRLGEVALTSTLVDDIQASTVLLEDGSEITKARLRIRNHTRQYLGLVLPEGAVLTHMLLDGRPVRPAVVSGPAGKQLLVPLRQSQRIVPEGGQEHVVRPGETLGEIALRYYSDAESWGRILADNEWQLADAGSVEVGQRLTITAADAAVRESSFVVELAYKRAHPPLGWLGRSHTSLPTVDVEVLSATWHLYLPTSVKPLAFDANLRQLSHIHYGPIRRLLHVVQGAFGVDAAWAGSDYRDILSQRKEIFATETRNKDRAADLVSTFPLVGDKVRFERILLGRDTPAVTVTYLAEALVGPIHKLGLLLAAALVVIGARPSGPRTRPALAVPVLGLFVVAHFVLGLHRHLLWGLLLGLAVAVAQAYGPRWWAAVRRGPPPRQRWLDMLTWRSLAMAFVALVALQWALSNPVLLQGLGVVSMVALLRRQA